ncbi:unnamed protein product [Calypogeia fissa]
MEPVQLTPKWTVESIHPQLVRRTPTPLLWLFSVSVSVVYAFRSFGLSTFFSLTRSVHRSCGTSSLSIVVVHIFFSRG